MASTSQSGSGSRKFGRSARGGAMARYNGTRRDNINKARKIAKHTKRCVGKTLKVARGTARAARRI
jgi:hypothetical protein